MQNKIGSRILVVDDEVRVCESIRALLATRGFDVYTACSVKESVEMAAEIPFDLYLIDKNLPVEDGFVLMDYILEKQPETPIIMMTGNASIDSAILALRKGAFDYLRKPFKYEELVNVVSNALMQKRLKDENRLITEKLNDSERRYREMIQNSPDLIIMLDRQGVINFVNNTFISTLGYKEEEINGTCLVTIIDEKYKELVLSFLGLEPTNIEKNINCEINSNEANLMEIGLANLPYYHNQSDYHNESDYCLDIEMVCSPKCLSEKRTIYIELKKSTISFNNSMREKSSDICIVGRDITVRKSFEQQMIYSQKMEAVAAIAGGVAHDFNNLLMGIHGYTAYIKSKLDIEHPCHKKLIAIERNLIKGSGLISQLLSFARGGLSTNVQTVNINSVIKETLELFLINRKNIEIHLDLLSDVWKLQVNIDQMEQVFLNMFINAAHAMKKGGDIFIRTENIILNEADAKQHNIKPGAYVKISIKDTGHGIEEANQKRIFDPFFSTKKRAEGSGLGLASAYNIIKNHNGTITVSSSPGEGALFAIYLNPKPNKECFDSDADVKKETAKPEKISLSYSLSNTWNDQQGEQDKKNRKSEEISINGISTNITSINGKAVTALVIDDETVAQETTSAILKEAGIQTFITGSGREGVQKYMEYLDKIDLVILDMVMPGMGGSETFKYIRKLNPDARILISSAYNHESEITTMLSEGRCDFLHKPFDQNVFLNKIKTLLSIEKVSA